jgi:REP element-mobilizing transposase RayT
MLVSSDDMIGFVRDFKKYTTKMILQNIEQFEPNLIIGLFTEEDGSHKIWQEGNMPEKIESEKFFLQKLKYIVNNPVKRYYVSNPEYWYWSSANRECELKIDEY